MNHREQDILHSIVESYIQTGEPVGSRTIAKLSREGLSSASVRNVMSDLEETGFLLDLLFERDGRTLTELDAELEMTRFGVMKHLRVLEEAGLVVSRKQGREKLHFLNPVPIRQIHDRWIDKFTERRVSALLDIKHQLEESA